MKLRELKKGDVCYIEKLNKMVIVFNNDGKREIPCIDENTKISNFNCNHKVIKVTNKRLINDYYKQYNY